MPKDGVVVNRIKQNVMNRQEAKRVVVVFILLSIVALAVGIYTVKKEKQRKQNTIEKICQDL